MDQHFRNPVQSTTMQTVSWLLSVSRYIPSHFPIIRPSQYKPKSILSVSYPPPSLPPPPPPFSLSTDITSLLFLSFRNTGNNKYVVATSFPGISLTPSYGAIETSGFRFRFRPFAASHSSGTKPPCWREKVALGQDKQRKLLFRIMYAFVCLVPVRRLLASTAGLYHVNG